MFSVRLVLALVSVSAFVACSPTTITEAIDALLEAGVENGRIPGVIAIAATSDGTVYQGAFGKRDTSSNADMAVNTILQIASMTKPITSVAAMQLVEQGKIELDRAVADYLPELVDIQVLEGFDADGIPILRAARTPVTVRQLLTHTSGFVYEFLNAQAAQYAQLGEVASIFEPGDGFLAAPLAFDPGTAWEYGISTAWVGVLVEVVSGQSLDDYFREHVFEPLRMHDTHFHLPEEKQSRLATIYSRSDEGSLIATGPRSNNPFFSGGGGLVSTAPDYVRFLRALLNGGALDGVRILSEETVDLMAQNHIGELEVADLMISAMLPKLSNDVNLLPDSVDKFGIGFLINAKPIPGGRSERSLAWVGIWNTYFWIDRDRDVCGVLMTQISPFGDADVIQLFAQFETAVYSSLSTAEN